MIACSDFFTCYHDGQGVLYQLGTVAVEILLKQHIESELHALLSFVVQADDRVTASMRFGIFNLHSRTFGGFRNIVINKDFRV